jgi:hypothetical protein
LSASAATRTPTTGQRHRSLAEICGQAWWLLEAGTGARGRVERPLCVRLRSAVEAAAEADEIGAADWPDYTETRQQVFGDSCKLGLDLPSRKATRSWHPSAHNMTDRRQLSGSASSDMSALLAVRRQRFLVEPVEAVSFVMSQKMLRRIRIRIRDRAEQVA